MLGQNLGWTGEELDTVSRLYKQGGGYGRIPRQATCPTSSGVLGDGHGVRYWSRS